MKRRGLAIAVAAVLAVLLLVGVGFLVRNVFYAPTKVTAYFPSATGIYAGDEVSARRSPPRWRGCRRPA